MKNLKLTVIAAFTTLVLGNAFGEGGGHYYHEGTGNIILASDGGSGKFSEGNGNISFTEGGHGKEGGSNFGNSSIAKVSEGGGN